MPAIRSHHGPTSDAAWDGPANEANLVNDGSQTYYVSAFAWFDGDQPAKKADFKFIHHEVAGDGTVGAANIRACITGIAVLNGARGGTTIPDADREGVWRHLATHIKDSNAIPPGLKETEQYEFKGLELALKQVGDEGSFTGDLSVYDFVDSAGEVVERGAFTKTLAENGGQVPMLWQHNLAMPAGIMGLKDSEASLVADGKFNLSSSTGAEAYSWVKFLAKNNMRAGLSIGFRTIKDSVTNGVRYIKELKLYEGSIVTLPMNRLATVHEVKTMSRTIDEMKDFAAALAAIQNEDLRYQLMQALSSSLFDFLYGSNDATMASADVGAFSTAMRAWIADHGGKGVKPLEQKATIVLSDLERDALTPVITRFSALLGMTPAAAGSQGTEPVLDHSALDQFRTHFRSQ